MLRYAAGVQVRTAADDRADGRHSVDVLAGDVVDGDKRIFGMRCVEVAGVFMTPAARPAEKVRYPVERDGVRRQGRNEADPEDRENPHGTTYFKSPPQIRPGLGLITWHHPFPLFSQAATTTFWPLSR